MDKNIIVSIIMPAYNAERYIELAIKSVLKQSFQDFEFIIINDGSRDKTREKILEFKDARIKLIENENNIGLQKSLNKGLSFSCGEYIARIDADDEWINEDKIKKQIEFLEKNRNYVLIGTGALCVNENGKFLFKYLKEELDKNIRKRITGYNCFIHSSVVFKKEAAVKVGMYPEDGESRHVEDYDLWLRLGMVGKMYNLPTYDVSYRMSEESISNKNKIKQLKDTIKIAKRYKKNYPDNKIFNTARNYARLIFHGYIKSI